MGRRIDDVTSAEFDALFTGFEHTAYRLETLQTYDVSYEAEPYRAFMAGHPRPRDSGEERMGQHDPATRCRPGRSSSASTSSASR